MPRRPGTGAPNSTDRVRNNMDMGPRKLRDARRVLSTRTETETADEALDYVVFTNEVFEALDTLAALGGLDDGYAKAAAPRRRKVAER